MRTIIIGFLLLTIVGLGLTTWVVREKHAQPVSPLTIDHPRIRTADGQKVAWGQLRTTQGQMAAQAFAGQWLLVAFGFTRCPDICPNTLARFKSIVADPKGSKTLFKFVFVTVDPTHDDPARLRSYIDHFSPKIYGVHGPKEELLQLAKSFATTFGATKSNSFYHSLHYFIVNPQGHWSGYIRAEDFAADLLPEDLSAFSQRNSH